jgi:hypothetical protein
LQQAIDCIHSPSVCIMAAASAVDAMLKERNYCAGGLYARIEQAVADHLLTEEMGQWAHNIRLDANDARHADFDVAMAEKRDAERAIEFAKALSQVLFVLPALVKRGIGPKPTPPTAPPQTVGQ